MNLFSEPMRRNVFRVAIAYLVASWLMLPMSAVIVVVLAFSFLGDDLRDAADSYS